MLVFLRCLSLSFAVLFIFLSLGTITLIPDESYVVFIWLALFIGLATLSILSFRKLGKWQTTPRPGRRGTILIISMNVILVCFIAALMIPGLIHGGAHQKRTIADIRSVGVAVESYAVDQGAYP